MGYNVNKGLNDLRAIKYWLQLNCIRGNSWLVIDELDQIVKKHSKLTLQDHNHKQLEYDQMNLSKNTFKYIYSTYMTESDLICIVEDKYNQVYVISNKNLSALNKNKENPDKAIIDEDEVEQIVDTKVEESIQDSEQLNPDLKKNSETEEQNDTLNRLNMLVDLVNLLDISRANDREQWLEIGLALHSIHKQFRYIWEFFSKKANCYDQKFLNTNWDNFNRIKNNNASIGEANLHTWAKHDNPVEYNKFVQKYNLVVNQNKNAEENCEENCEKNAEENAEEKNCEENCEENVENCDIIEDVESHIVICPDLISAINYGLSSIQRSKLGIVKTNKMSFKDTELEMLDKIHPFDFSECQNEQEFLKLWHQYLIEKIRYHQKKNSIRINLDLSGHYNITAEILEKTNKRLLSKFTELALSQNVQLKKILWLRHFTGLDTLSFWYCQQITDDYFALISKILPNLKSVNIHNCFKITNKTLLHLLFMKKVEKICLDNKLMICQNNPYQGVISSDDWETINNTTLKYLSINSDNLTNDVIHFVLKSCHNLKKLLTNTLVLNKLRTKIIEGYGPEEVTFQSNEDLRLGFKAKREIKIKDLLKDQFEEKFSDSMKDLITKLEAGEEKRELEEKRLEQEILEELSQEYGQDFIKDLL